MTIFSDPFHGMRHLLLDILECRRFTEQDFSKAFFAWAERSEGKNVYDLLYECRTLTFLGRPLPWEAADAVISICGKYHRVQHALIFVCKVLDIEENTFLSTMEAWARCNWPDTLEALVLHCADKVKFGAPLPWEEQDER